MLLEINNLKKYFTAQKGLGRRQTSLIKAVDGVDLSVKDGENLSLVGESGCGKSTLAKLVLKLMPADRGAILYEGEDIAHAGNRLMSQYRKNLQMVFQDPYSSLDPRYTVRSIIKEPMHLVAKDYPHDSDKERKMKEGLNAVGLHEDVLTRYPHEFSGGERQRIAIARCLVLNPKLLILDEAVSSLDVLIQQQIIDLLVDLQKKFSMTYMFISHNLRVVKKISRQVAVMYQGKIVEIGPVEEIFTSPLHSYTRELLAAALNYEPAVRERSFVLPFDAKLQDKGNGHFVLPEINS